MTSPLALHRATRCWHVIAGTLGTFKECRAPGTRAGHHPLGRFRQAAVRPRKLHIFVLLGHPLPRFDTTCKTHHGLLHSLTIWAILLAHGLEPQEVGRCLLGARPGRDTNGRGGI